MGSLPTCECKKKHGEEEVVFPQGQDNITVNPKEEQKASALPKRNKVTEEPEKAKAINVKQNSDTNATSLTNNNNNNNVIFPHNININNISRHNQSSFILPPIQNDNGNNILDVSSSVDNMAMEVYEDKIEIRVNENESKASQSQVIENDLEVHFTHEDDLKKEKVLKDRDNIQEEVKEEEEKENNNKENDKEVIPDGDSMKETEIRKNRSINEGGSEVISSLNKDIGIFIKKFNRNGSNNLLNSDDMFLTSRKWTTDGPNPQDKSLSFDMQLNVNKEEEDKKSYKSEEIKKSKRIMDVKEEVLSQENSEEDKISEMEKEEKKNEDLESEEGNEDIYENENEENYDEKPEKITYNNNDYQNHKSEKNDSNKEIEENDNNLYIVNLKYNIPSIKNINKIRENTNEVEVEEKDNVQEILHTEENESENENQPLKNEYKNKIKLETPYKSDKVSVRTNEILKSLNSHRSASSNKEYEDGNYVTTNGNNTNNNSKIEQVELFKNQAKEKDLVVESTTNNIVENETNANTNQPQTKETLSSHRQHNDYSITENIKKNYEVSSPISHSILNITTHANHFDIQSTKEIQETLFTLSSQVKQKTEEKEVLSECNPIQIDLTLSNDNVVPNTTGKVELLQQSFDIEIVSEHNLTQVNSRAKIKSNSKSKVKMEIIKEKNKKLSKLQTKLTIPKSPFFVDVLFYSELKKFIQNTYDIKLHNGLLYAKRFCALTKTRFEYYTSKEQFILLQKPTCSIQNNKIQQARLISSKEINKKIKSKIKNHFEILYYIDVNNYNNLNNTHANENAIYEAENEDEHEQLLKVIFASEKEEIAKYWVNMINSICFINKN